MRAWTTMWAGMPLAAALAASPAFAGEPALGGGEPLDVSLGRVVVALVICIIIAALAVLMLRQRSGKLDLASWFSRIETRRRSIHVVETRRLSQHADLCLVRHDGTEYLLLLMAGHGHVLREQRTDDPQRVGAAPCG